MLLNLLPIRYLYRQEYICTLVLVHRYPFPPDAQAISNVFDCLFKSRIFFLTIYNYFEGIHYCIQLAYSVKGIIYMRT